jgi:cytochrome c-type protein NapB
MFASYGHTSLLMALVLGLAGCSSPDRVPVPGAEGTLKSIGEARAVRRLYDGAPPVIPHEVFGADCGACHDARGTALRGVGFAPAAPHEGTAGADGMIRCRQCHVSALTDQLFVESSFQALRQDLRGGARLYQGAPPTIPHDVFMRENCQACHTGPGARPEILTSHPERARCRQCHVPVVTRDVFTRSDKSGQEGSEEP